MAQNQDTSIKSEDHRKIMTRQEHKRYRLEKMKIQFKNITNKIHQIKKQNTHDQQQLNQMINTRNNFEQLTFKSLEKAKQVITYSQRHIPNFASQRKILYAKDNQEDHHQTLNQSIVLNDKCNLYLKEQQIDILNHIENFTKQSVKDADISKANQIDLESDNSISDLKEVEVNFHYEQENNIQQFNRKQTQFTNQCDKMMTSRKTKQFIPIMKASKKMKGYVLKQSKSRQHQDSILPFIAAIIFSIILLFCLS